MRAFVAAGVPGPEVSSAAPGPQGEYFRRVKARVGKNWDLNSVRKARDPDGTRFGKRDRYTILDVTLDATGAISAMTVRRSAGLAWVDDAALDAMRRAAPVGAPPPGLLGADGTLGLLGADGTFSFPFGFYVEAAGTPPRCRPRSDEPETAMPGDASGLLVSLP